MLLRPTSFFAAAGGRASYAGPIIYALACHAIAVLFAGAHDTICDQDHCNDATVFRIPEEQERYEYGSP